ncbi:MAG TPA: ribosome recycling factor [Planctomycetota bacterium]|nr:ribosome recycling factor [Planctomycetota bacterium]
MPYDDIYLDASDRMDKAVQHLKEQLRTVRSSRATPGLIENVRVDYYGAPTPLKQIAGIGAPDPQLLVIKPYDPNALEAIQKAIQASSLGLTPAVDGRLIRLVVPPLSEERRRQIAGQLRNMAEETRVAIRNVRRDSLRVADQEKKDGTIPEDDFFRLKDDIQELTSDHEKATDEALEHKTAEIMEV